jgi:hypothetical protein
MRDVTRVNPSAKRTDCIADEAGEEAQESASWGSTLLIFLGTTGDVFKAVFPVRWCIL